MKMRGRLVASTMRLCAGEKSYLSEIARVAATSAGTQMAKWYGRETLAVR